MNRETFANALEYYRNINIPHGFDTWAYFDDMPPVLKERVRESMSNRNSVAIHQIFNDDGMEVAIAVLNFLDETEKAQYYKTYDD